jgi:D-glycero-alpha-D-manno-heptose-7-phosphate kinase
MIISKTPYRVSLFGGGTDYPEWFNFYGGKVINLAINKYVYISINKIFKTSKNAKYKISYSKIEYVKNLSKINHNVIKQGLKFFDIKDGMEIHYHGELPSKSGVGSSSAFVVGLIHAMNDFLNRTITKKKLAKDSIFFEHNILNETVGCQDQIASSYGGLNEIFFRKNNFIVNNFKTKKKNLTDNLLLVFSGKQRIGQNIANSYVQKLKDKKKNILIEMMKLYPDAKRSILSNDILSFGKILDESWLIKKKLSNYVSSPYLENFYDYLKKLGVLGVKIIGAGGGGFFLVAANNNIKKKLLTNKKIQCVDFKIDNLGSRILVNE